MASRSQSNVTWAAVTAVLYFLLAITATQYYRKFQKIVESNKVGGIHQSHAGKFDEAKCWFFLFLAICATADIPLFLGCIIAGGPQDCEWNTLSYAFAWFLHICAVCGYAYTIICPCILWSDMFQKKDGILFLTKYPVDTTKRLFQLSLCAYFVCTFFSVIVGIMFYKVSNSRSFTSSNIFYEFSILIEPAVILLIATWCLWSGIQLQLYVRRAKLGLLTEIRFLVHMNVTMAVITITYLTRALFILRLLHFMPANYRAAFNCTYPVWLIVTRWLPYIFCSFCLIFMMRASGAEVARSRSVPNNEGIGSILRMFSIFPVRNPDDEEKQIGRENSVAFLSGGFIDEGESLLSELLLSDDHSHVDSLHMPVLRAVSGASSVVSDDPAFSSSHDGLLDSTFTTTSALYSSALEVQQS